MGCRAAVSFLQIPHSEIPQQNRGWTQRLINAETGADLPGVGHFQLAIAMVLSYAASWRFHRFRVERLGSLANSRFS